VPVSLLDVNVLLALAWPNNLHHEAAHRWFAEKRRLAESRVWATCPHTQLEFLRLSMQPAVVKTAISFADAQQALTASISAVDHEFWPMAVSFIDVAEDIRSRIAGHQQLADAVLLDLAVRNSGRLATFDHRIVNLVKPGSPSEAALELIPV
jgi:toxin-antitoxin system PIN domain toxin